MSRRYYYLFQVFFIVIAVGMQIFLFSQKSNFHIDELFSFGLANGVNGVYLYKDTAEIDNKLLYGEQFNAYLTQQEGSSYGKMWKNLVYDNHMPFYFVLLRFVNSFFPPIFSGLPGIILNILVLIGLLIGFCRLSLLVFNDRMIALLSMLLLIFFQPLLSLEVYIRMYLLQMMLAVFLLMWAISFFVSDNLNKKNVVLGIVFSYLLILSHYYSLFFCFWVAAAGSFIYLMKRQYKKMFWFGGIMSFSVLVAALTYPAMLNVAVNGERGSQFVALTQELREGFFEFIKERISLFGSTIWLGCLELIVLLVSVYFAQKRKKLLLADRKNLIFLSVVLCGYGIFLILFMPVMQNFQIRYFAPIIPIMVLIFVYILKLGCDIIKLGKSFVCIFTECCFLQAVVMCVIQDSPFYMRKTKESEKLEHIVKNSDIWWGFGGGFYGWMLHMYIDKLALAEKVWVLDDYDSNDFLRFANEEKKQGKYAYLLMPKQQEKSPEGGISWIKEKTGRTAYYLFTSKIDNVASMVFEASVFLVCPY